VRTLAIVSFLIAAENALLVAFCLALKPAEHSMGFTYLAWMIVPALTAAIGTVNRHWGPVATVITALISVTLWDWLLLERGLFWEEGYHRPLLAAIYAAVGIAIGMICAAFVWVIRHAVDSSSAGGQMGVALRKAASFGILCSLIAAILFFFFGQPAIGGRGPNVDRERSLARDRAAVGSVALLIIGTVGATTVGALVGQVYRRRSKGQ